MKINKLAPAADFPVFDAPTLLNEMAGKMRQASEDVLTKVVQMVLGRDYFTLDEVKEFSYIYHESYPGRQFIGYRGNLIGEMVIDYPTTSEDGTTVKMGYTFVPKKEFSE